VANKTLVAL